ncbi:MAG: hypothetical protein NT056_06010 [Proteobacteria bacterium]|nr:hypothetical protein [Pseudomonadota bacterium]
MKWMRVCFLSLLAFLALLSSTVRAEEYKNPLDPPVRSDDPAWTQAMSFWDKRSEDSNAKKALEIFKSLAAAHPDQIEPELWLLRANYYAGLKERKHKRAALLEEAVSHGKKALAREPGNYYALYWMVGAYSHFENLKEIPPEAKTLAAKLPRGRREIPVPADTPEWKTALALWDARVDRDKAWQAAEIFRKLTEENPKSLEARLWLTRSYYWLGRSGKTPEERKKIFYQGYKYGLEAVKLSPHHPWANYWAMCHLARYGELGSFVKKASLALEIINLIHLTDLEEPLYYFSGIPSVLIWSLADTNELTRKLVPTLLGIPADMRQVLKMAFVLEPNYFDVRVGFVKWYISIKDYRNAREEINYILNTPANSLRGYEAENILSQDIARDLLEQIDNK